MWRMAFIPRRLGPAGRFMISKRTELPFGFDFGGVPAQPQRLKTLFHRFFRTAKKQEVRSDDLSDMLSRCEVDLERDD
jgi:hypothetical protein